MRQAAQEVTTKDVALQLEQYRNTLQDLSARKVVLEQKLANNPKDKTLESELRTLGFTIGATKGKMNITLLDAAVYGAVYHQDPFKIIPESEVQILKDALVTAKRITDLPMPSEVNGNLTCYVPSVDGIKHPDRLKPGRGKGQEFYSPIFKDHKDMFNGMDALGVYSVDTLTDKQLALTSQRSLAARVPFLDDKGNYSQFKTVITTCGINLGVPKGTPQAEAFVKNEVTFDAQGRTFTFYDLNEENFSVNGYGITADKIARAQKAVADGEMLYAPPIGMGLFLRAFDCDLSLHIAKLDELPADRIPDSVTTNASCFFDPANPGKLVYFKNKKGQEIQAGEPSFTRLELNLKDLPFRDSVKNFANQIYQNKVGKDVVEIPYGKSFELNSFDLSNIQTLTNERFLHENRDIKNKAIRCIYKDFNNAMKKHGQKMTIVIWEGAPDCNAQLEFAQQVAKEQGFENLGFIKGNIKNHDFILNAGDDKSAGGLFIVVKDGEYVPVDEQLYQESMAALVLTNMNPFLNTTLAEFLSQKMQREETPTPRDNDVPMEEERPELVALQQRFFQQPEGTGKSANAETTLSL